MRTIWKGMIAFGLVNIPVKLYTATRDHSVSFRNLCPEHHEPLKYKRWCPKGEHEVDYNEMQKGYEIGDTYVVIEKEELDKLKLDSSSTIDIDKFVDVAEVPVLAYDTYYYVVPDKGGEKAYSLLHEVLTLTGNMAVGKVVLRSKEYVVGIKNYKKGMILITLRYADEIVDLDQVLSEELPEPSEKEEELAKMLVEKLANDLDLSEYEDRYRTRVQELVEKKLKGESVEIEKVSEVEKTKDILEALEKSIEK
ncbi:MAG: Ku protein [Candidatus Methanofastidiosia archaeon]